MLGLVTATIRSILLVQTIPTVCGTHRFRLEIGLFGVSELEFSASGEAAEAHVQFLLYVMKLLRYLGAALLV